jgi:hypothetical protein
MFQQTGKFEPLGQFSEISVMGDKHNPGIWHAHIKSVQSIFMPAHKQHRFNALIDKASEYIDIEDINDEMDVQGSGGAYVIDVPSSPL